MKVIPPSRNWSMPLPSIDTVIREFEALPYIGNTTDGSRNIFANAGNKDGRVRTGMSPDEWRSHHVSNKPLVVRGYEHIHYGLSTLITPINNTSASIVSDYGFIAVTFDRDNLDKSNTVVYRKHAIFGHPLTSETTMTVYDDLDNADVKVSSLVLHGATEVDKIHVSMRLPSASWNLAEGMFDLDISKPYLSDVFMDGARIQIQDRSKSQVSKKELSLMKVLKHMPDTVWDFSKPSVLATSDVATLLSCLDAS